MATEEPLPCIAWRSNTLIVELSLLILTGRTLKINYTGIIIIIIIIVVVIIIVIYFILFIYLFIYFSVF